MLIISSSSSFSFSSYVAGCLGGSSKEDLLRSDSAWVDRNTGDGRGGGATAALPGPAFAPAYDGGRDGGSITSKPLSPETVLPEKCDDGRGGGSWDVFLLFTSSIERDARGRGKLRIRSARRAPRR